MTSSIEIRKARNNDRGDIAGLMYSAGPELYDYVYKSGAKDAREFIAYEFKSGRGFCGHKNVTVAVHEGEVVGTACFYGREQYRKLLLGTTANAIAFFGLRGILPVLQRSLDIESVMKPPRKAEIYLANFGVSPKVRGMGVGTQIINTTLESLKDSHYRVFGLDVADTNPRAESLYARLGLNVVKFKTFTGNKRNILVPNSKKMEKELFF